MGMKVPSLTGGRFTFRIALTLAPDVEIGGISKIEVAPLITLF